MTLLTSILTDATCGFGCWMAREKVCRCSCGGKNHGMMLVDGVAQPEKQIKIDGFRYKLHTIGSYHNMNTIASEALMAYGWARIETNITYGDGTPYHLGWEQRTMKGSPIRVTKPSQDQMQKWDELQSRDFRDCYILWVRIDPPDPLWCKADDCIRCNMRGMYNWLRSAGVEVREYELMYGGIE